MLEARDWRTQYAALTTRLQQQYRALPTDAPVRLAKRTSNLFRPRAAATSPGLDVLAFDGVLNVDPEARTAEVLGMTTYEHLVDATLPFGMMPMCVPQLRTITLGGAVTGLGIESASFRFGTPHESVTEMDILTGAGDVITVSGKPEDPHRDLFFGFANLIPFSPESVYAKDLKSRFDYLLCKHKLEICYIEPVQFFKHRPDNFPTIRLAQLAMLYHKQQNLFSKAIVAKTVKELRQLFDITISDYWQTHYQFDKASPKKKKQFSKSFIDLLVINTIVPIQFAYAKSQGKETSESLIDLLREVAAEKNVIIEKFSNFGIKAKNAFETQSLLQLKNEYCNHGKCLQCAVGIQLLKE